MCASQFLSYFFWHPLLFREWREKIDLHVRNILCTDRACAEETLYNACYQHHYTRLTCASDTMELCKYSNWGKEKNTKPHETHCQPASPTELYDKHVSLGSYRRQESNSYMTWICWILGNVSLPFTSSQDRTLWLPDQWTGLPEQEQHTPLQVTNFCVTCRWPTPEVRLATTENTCRITHYCLASRLAILIYRPHCNKNNL